MTKKKSTKKTKAPVRMAARKSKPVKKKAAKKAPKKAPKKTAKPPVNVSGLRGFARLAALDPDRLKAISAKAGKKAQKLYGKKVRWSKKKAQALASLGGKAAQKKYKQTGHPWASGSPLRVDSSKFRGKTERDRRARRDRSDRRQRADRRTHRRVLPGAAAPVAPAPLPPPPSVEAPVAEGVSLAPSDAQPETAAE